jgi:hypothetical protein
MTNHLSLVSRVASMLAVGLFGIGSLLVAAPAFANYDGTPYEGGLTQVCAGRYDPECIPKETAYLVNNSYGYNNHNYYTQPYQNYNQNYYQQPSYNYTPNYSYNSYNAYNPYQYTYNTPAYSYQYQYNYNYQYQYGSNASYHQFSY